MAQRHHPRRVQLDDKPFLVIRNTFPKSSISKIMSNYFRKFLNMNVQNDSKVYVASRDDIDDVLDSSAKMGRFGSDSSDRGDATVRTTVTLEPSSRSVGSLNIPKLSLPMPVGPPPIGLQKPFKKRKFTALIVDDSVVHRKILTKMFSGNGFAVAELSDGLEVVEIIRRVMKTLPKYSDHFQEPKEEDDDRKSVKAMHDSVEQRVGLVAGPVSLSGKSAALTESVKERRRSLSTSPSGSSSSSSSSSSICSHSSGIGSSTSPSGPKRRHSADHLANYYSDPIPSSSVTTARQTPRLLQFALTNHKTGPDGMLAPQPIVSLEDAMVDSVAPQVMLKLRKENIDLQDFIESRQEVIKCIDNEQFNEAYFNQALGVDRQRHDDEAHSDSESSVVDHPAVGVVGQQMSIVREMSMNSPRVMGNILEHLAHLNPHGDEHQHTIMFTEDAGLRMENYDATDGYGAGQGVPKMMPSELSAKGRSSKSNKMLTTFEIRNTLTNEPHVCADSMASAINITRAFDTIAHEDWQSIDVIIMDFVMVNMNGPEAVRHLREMGYNGLIIGLTAKALSNDINIFLIHGVDAVFSKPLNWPLFLETFEILHEQNQVNHHGEQLY